MTLIFYFLMNMTICAQLTTFRVKEWKRFIAKEYTTIQIQFAQIGVLDFEEIFPSVFHSKRFEKMGIGLGDATFWWTK
jgi:hypothetical protein